MIKVKYEDSVKKAFKFALKPKLLALLFSFYLILFIPFIYFLWIFLEYRDNVGYIISSVVGLLLWVIIYTLILIIVSMILVDNYVRKKSLKQSFNHVKPMYLRMLGVTLVVVLISSVAGMVPYIGFIFSILVGLIFLFVTQHVVIANKRFGDVFESSWKLLKKETGDVILTWIIALLIQGALIFMFAIPLIIIFIQMFLSGNFLTAGLANIVLLVIGGLILLKGMVISALFNIGFLTDVYVQLRKKAKF
jgi:hypothetical protein